MRTLLVGILLFAVIVVAAMFVTGVIRVNDTPGEMNITVDKEEIKEQTQEAVKKAAENGSELFRETGSAIKRTGEDLKQEANRLEAEQEAEPQESEQTSPSLLVPDTTSNSN